jgi:hypothetical protein
MSKNKDINNEKSSPSSGADDHRVSYGENSRRVAPDPLSGSQLIERARFNSKMAMAVALACSVMTLFAVIFSGFILRNRNHVAVIPVGELWELPMVHWINTPNRYEESAKPIHVALKYIRGIYEIDPLDFSENLVGEKRIMLSDKISELLAYVIPGTDEYLKANQALEKSHAAYKMYDDCNCVKRLLISDIMVDTPPLPVIRIEAVGRYVIFGADGRSPLPADDLGYKSVVLYLAKDIPLAESVGAGDDEVRVLNGEGWYVIRSTMKSLSKNEIDALRKVRKYTGMKEAL